MPTKPILLNETFVEKMDVANIMLSAIAENLGGLKFENFEMVQSIVRAGLAHKVFSKYHQFAVEKEQSVTASTTGSGITAATVDANGFVTAVGSSATATYEFIFDGLVWKHGDAEVVLSNYGITITGTPAEEDSIIVSVTANEVICDVLGIDEDTPVDTAFEHTLTIVPHNVTNYNVLAFKKPQALFYVNPTTYPDGLAAGTYNITLDHGSNGAGTEQDGTYQFTLTQPVPAGGAIRHSTIGVYQSGGYTKAQIVAGKFTTYNTIANKRAVIESNIATTEGSAGTNLGTFTAENATYRSSADCNFTIRCAYGSHKYADSDERMWMNSNKSGMTDGIPNWFEFKTVFDLPASANIPGWLSGLDPALVRVMGKVKKRTYLSVNDRNGGANYEDTEELVFPLSMSEIGLGANDGVHENTVYRDGTVKTTPYSYYKDAAQADRIKYEGTAACYWWLRSCSPSHCGNERYVNPSGALYSNGSNATAGAVPACVIV